MEDFFSAATSSSFSSFSYFCIYFFNFQIFRFNLFLFQNKYVILFCTNWFDKWMESNVKSVNFIKLTERSRKKKSNEFAFHFDTFRWVIVHATHAYLSMYFSLSPSLSLTHSFTHSLLFFCEFSMATLEIPK